MKHREFKLTNLAINNRVTIYFISVVIVLMGIISYLNTPKESFPEVVFPYFAISTIYPGTSPSDMENLVTRPIEKMIKGIDGIKEVSSNSLQDFSLIFIEFETGIDNQVAYEDVKEAVDKAKAYLPDNLLDDPEISKIDLSEIPILNINLSGDMGLEQLKKYAEDLQDAIESLSEITRVDIVGALEREIQIEVDLYKMQAAGFNFNTIQNIVAYENMTISAGQISTGGMKRTMRVVGEFTDVEQLMNLVLSDGVRLKDIAEVKDDFADRESYARLDGQDVITLNVIRKSGKNLLDAIDKIKEIIEKHKDRFPENLVITLTGDQSTYTRDMVNNLFNTMVLGFIVVVLILMFFMGVENSLFVAVAIPLSILIAFICIPLMNFTLNMVVLMSFILVLGIVVDNSIVVVENIYRHFMNTPGLSIKKAAKIGTAEVALPVFTGTLTTMAPFFPLAFWPGIMGKFMMYIPITIIVTLFASMIVAYVMNPVFNISFMKYRPEEKVQVNHKKNIIASVVVVLLCLFSYIAGISFLGNLIVFVFLMYLLVRYVLINLIKRFQKSFIPRMSRLYQRSLSLFIKGRRPYFVIGGTVILLFFTFFLMGVRPPKIVLFPESDPKVVYTYIVMPAGTDIDVTDSICRVVEEMSFGILGKNNPDVESVISNVAINAGESVFERTTESKLAKITINFKEYQDRTGLPTSSYVEEFREAFKAVSGAQITVSTEEMGPPTGKPINIEISGEDFEELIPLVDRLKNHIDSLKIPGIEELKSDIEVNTPELIIHIDRAKANKLGISTGYVGSMLRTAVYGSEISTFREGEDEYDIRLRLMKTYREDLNALMNLEIAVPSGQNGPYMIPLSAVASIDFSSSYGGVKRKDFERVITLYSNVLSGYNANEIVAKIRNSLKHFDLPENYTIAFTGEQQDQEENAGFLSFAFLMAVILIFVILVAQFNSIAKPIIIIIQILFSMIGVLLGLVIFQVDLSVIMTGMGIIAVGGIVVKNAIILIDYTDILIKEGIAPEKAIIEAGAIRLTPVILTAASTILGLLPLAIGMNIDFASLFTNLNPNIYFGGDSVAFWKPLAWTIIFGLTFATFLTLIVIPAFYKIVILRKKTAGQ
jgi:multidrug efflux pump